MEPSVGRAGGGHYEVLQNLILWWEVSTLFYIAGFWRAVGSTPSTWTSLAMILVSQFMLSPLICAAHLLCDRASSSAKRLGDGPWLWQTAPRGPQVLCTASAPTFFSRTGQMLQAA